jgi:hypothetical protein
MQHDDFIEGLTHRLPAHLRDSFTDDQLAALKVAFGARQWGQHPVDLRGTIGFFHWRYYFVVLAGRQRRHLSRLEHEISRMAAASAIGIFLFLSILTGLLTLYLMKSALGIDVLPDTSLGIWDWFKQHVF